MKDSGLLRFFDKYIGTAICFILSILFKLRPKPKTKKIKNVLVMELFEMGAAFMTHPSLRYIKKKSKDASIYCLTIRNMKSSWELLGLIPKENIYVVQDKNIFAFFISLISNIWKLRSKHIDLVIDYELFMRISAIISAMIKTKYRAGFYNYDLDGLYRGSFYDFKCGFNQNSHIMKNFLALTKTAMNFENALPNYKQSISFSELSQPKYESDSKLREKLTIKLKKEYRDYEKNKIITICPDVGLNIRVRNYPKDSFVEVIKKLLHSHPEHLVVLTGVSENMEICKYIAGKVNDKRCINFCSKTDSLKELFELLSMSEMLISNDNGPAHFASITNTKTLALFSTDSPFIYGPFGRCMILYKFFQCSPCIYAYNHKKTRCNDNKCVQAIKPEEVYEAAEKVLSDNFNERTVNNTLRYI